MVWDIEELTGYQEGYRYLIVNKRTGGYLADNNGGALHFLKQSDALAVCQLMNSMRIL